MTRFLRWGTGVFALAAIVTGGWVAWPLPGDLLAPPAEQSLTITDRHGLVLRDTRAGDGSLARWVTLDRMDPDLPRAFVAVEDQRFERHHGVDLRAVGRALRDNARRGRVVSGASTITMQLARLLRPIGRGYGDKVVQALWALRLEAHLGKPQVLEQYLNRVPLGQGAVGVAAAMRLYFGASAEQASLGQAALLAGLARAPSSQNPLVAPARAADRRAFALRLLVEQGYASAMEVSRALHEPLLALDDTRPFLAPHFTSRLLLAAEEAGGAEQGTWRTSLDLDLQAELEDEVRHTVQQLADRGVRQAAAVVLDNRTGEVLAWVGSPDFWSDSAGQVDMVVSPRQPGSALKPVLYALAFDRGVTAATVLADIATTYQTAGGPYHPRNYDRRYHGPVRAREALASSYNVPAVSLADRIGTGALLHGLQEAGFVSLARPADFYGLGLALGNGDVSLLELANGYRTLANGGVWTPWRTRPGDVNAPDTDGRRVVSPEAAALTLDILTDADARAPAFGVRTPFNWPFRAAAKTGTSRHFTDNWAVGVTRGFTVAVWAGNFSGQPMEGVSGISGAGPLLHRAILLVAQRYQPGDLVHPVEAGLVPAAICRTSGMLAGPECPTLVEHFVPGTAPGALCDWHRGGQVRLPVAYAEWRADSRRVGGAGAIGRPGDSTVTPGAVSLAITSPQAGDRYRIPPGVNARFATVALRASGARERVRWYVDGTVAPSGRWPLQPGEHDVVAVAGDERDSVRITVEAP